LTAKTYFGNKTATGSGQTAMKGNHVPNFNVCIPF